MKFWDSSALVPLLVEEAPSERCRSLLRQSPEIVVWALARVEILSALHRRRREGSLSGPALAEVLRRFSKLTGRFSEITDLESVRRQAQALLERHRLSAADALQLAAARIACGDEPGGWDFLCLDARLRDAAAEEGFAVEGLA